jgi:hypothetical protein
MKRWLALAVLVVAPAFGGALLRDGQAVEAEKVFRADLERNPRSLLGLWQSLTAQKKDSDAVWVRSQFDAAAKDATVTLDVNDL